ncbi:DUF3575 domain-containing protein [Flavobacterium sp. XS1P32]|uniref:DUF3575 domain-containing protein n=1 Tax=unclassified Flavobacterium TaxID=196869 RepID=UPI003AB0EA57
MRKLFVVLCFSSFLFGFSQEKETIDFKRNELKGNALFLVAGVVEITYERLITEDSGVGISFFYGKREGVNSFYYVTPYYRAYFGKKPAAGFFIEGFGMLNSEVETYSYYDGQNYKQQDKRLTDFALGFGLGSKWIHKRGFVFEINAGIGRNLFNNNVYDVVPRAGITLGYRF